MARQHLTLSYRFWSKVSAPDHLGCREWLRAKNARGYGVIRVNHKMHLAHRMAWILTHGDIPAGDHRGTACVLHRCDNPACVNPAHLFIGTHRDNMADMISKGRADHTRAARGSSNGSASLSESEVLLIRSSTKSQRRLARELGVHQTTIGKVRRGQTWAHL